MSFDKPEKKIRVSASFKPESTYRVGVRKTLDTRAKNIKFETEYKELVKPGEYFISRKCPDFFTYLKKNPDNLNSEINYHCYEIINTPDGKSQYIYVGEGMPEPYKEKETASSVIAQANSMFHPQQMQGGNGYQPTVVVVPQQPLSDNIAPPPPQQPNVDVAELIKSMNEHGKDSSQTLLSQMQQQFEMMQRNYVSQIEMYQKVIHDMKTSDKDQYSYLAQSLETRNEEIRSIRDSHAKREQDLLREIAELKSAQGNNHQFVAEKLAEQRYSYEQREYEIINRYEAKITSLIERYDLEKNSNHQKYEESIEDFNIEIDTLREEKQQLALEIAQLKKDIESLTNNNTSLQDQLSKKHEEYQSLQDDVSETDNSALGIIGNTIGTLVSNKGGELLLQALSAMIMTKVIESTKSKNIELPKEFMPTNYLPQANQQGMPQHPTPVQHAPQPQYNPPQYQQVQYAQPAPSAPRPQYATPQYARPVNNYVPMADDIGEDDIENRINEVIESQANLKEQYDRLNDEQKEDYRTKIRQTLLHLNQQNDVA